MAATITGSYTGDLRVEAVHQLSGTRMTMAAPLDNHGDGSSFSPTDLVATALAGCVLTVMGIAARNHGIPFEGATFTIEKHMASDPRRIAALPLVIRMPAGLEPDQRATLERVGRHCPVHRSLDPSVDTPVEFEYPH